ncbi:hypothetical protein KAR91_22500 [Candidatus Pacearchaeota archaeon]|nr:hypothetical protein [Candidatus Pacearchaeota archaeon]
MKILLLATILTICSCIDDGRLMECTKIKKVHNCSDGHCRVSFDNGDRQTVGVVAEGDEYCKKYYLRKDGSKNYINGIWWEKEYM